MNIEQFIQDNSFYPRLQTHGCCVVYDPEQIYREICLDIASEKIAVVDASLGSIEARLAAIKYLQKLGSKQLDGLLVYVPKAVPITDEDKMLDPFFAVAAAGSF